MMTMMCQIKLQLQPHSLAAQSACKPCHSKSKDKRTPKANNKAFSQFGIKVKTAESKG